MKAWTFIKNHFTFLRMDSENRKFGLRGGLEKSAWYIRLDLWAFGIRIS